MATKLMSTVKKSKMEGYTVYTHGHDTYFLEVLKDFLHCRLHTLKVLKSTADTKVSIVEREEIQYVLKVVTPKEKYTERFLKSFFRGDYFLALMKQTAMLREKGVTFPSDFHLLAETKIFNFASKFIMIFEYIPGVEMSAVADNGQLTEKLKHEVLEKINILHCNHMVFDDAHKGNFMLSENQVRVIDLSGKSYNRFRAAKDFIDLEKHFGIPSVRKDFFYYWVKNKSLYRKKVKALKARLREGQLFTIF